MPKQLIGKRSEAEFIAALLTRDWSHRAAVEAAGFEYLGAGCYREVWGSPDGKTVYKVDDGHDSSSNRSEIRRARSLRRRSNLPADIYIPVVSQYSFPNPRPYHRGSIVITAMEWIHGEPPANCWHSSFDDRIHCECKPKTDAECMRFRMSRLGREVRSNDIHSGNVIVMEDGRFAIIDLQM